MKLIEFKCPACGANLKADPAREVMYCEYCGQKLILDDEAMHIKMTIENAREAGYEFEQGRMQARSGNVRSELDKIQRMINALPEYERLKSRYGALDQRFHEDNDKPSIIAFMLGWVMLCLILIHLIGMNISSLLYSHAPVRIIAILVLIWIIVMIIRSQYSKHVQLRKKSEEIIKQRDIVMSEINALLKDSGLDSIQEKYRTMECLQFFSGALRSQTADTVSQAIQNYELYQRQLELAEQNERQLEIQERQLKELQEMRDKMDEKRKEKEEDDDDDSNALGTVAAIGLGVLVGRFFFKKW